MTVEDSLAIIAAAMRLPLIEAEIAAIKRGADNLDAYRPNIERLEDLEHADRVTLGLRHL